MEQKKNLCAQVPLSLHAQVSEAREAAGQTTSEYITNLLPFQELKADCKFPTIQLSLKKKSPPEMRLKLRRIFDILYKEEDGPSGPPSLCLHRADGGQNFFREGYNQPAEDAENALGPLAGIVGLDAHAKLDDAPAQDDHAHGLDAGENKIRKVVDDGKRVAASGQGGNGKGGAEDQEHDGAPIETAGAAV